MFLPMALFSDFWWLSNIPLYMFHNFFIHSSVSAHLGCSPVLPIVNSAAMNTGAHVSFWIIVLPGYTPRNRVAGSYGNSIFSFLKNPHTVFQSGYTNLNFYQQNRRAPFFSHSPVFAICRLFNDGHPDQCEVVPYCSFHLHFSNN